MSEESRIKAAFEHYGEEGAQKQRWSRDNLGNQAILRERVHLLGKQLRKAGVGAPKFRTVLEVGCGDGSELAAFEGYGFSPNDLTGVDLLKNRIDEAKRLFPNYSFVCCNAEQIPFPDEAFDVVLVSTVFSSILDPKMLANVVSEMDRVLRPGGVVVIYEFRVSSPWNLNTQGVSPRRIVELFPQYKCSFWRTTVVPQVSRRLGILTNLLYRLLSSIPWLKTHYIGLLRKGPQA